MLKNKRIKLYSAILVIACIISNFSIGTYATYTDEGIISASDPQQYSKSYTRYDYRFSEFSDIMPSKTLHNHVSRVRDSEDLFSLAFQNDDGTRSIYFFNEIIKYYEDGQLKDKDNTIITTTEVNGYRYTNKSNDIKVYFPLSFKNKSNSLGVKLKYGDIELDANPIPFGKITTSVVSAPIVEGNEITYNNVFDSNTKIKYTTLYSGYKEEIILERYTGIYEFGFSIYTHGLSIEQKEDGSFYVVDSESNTNIKIGDIVVFDSGNSFTEGSISIIEIVPNFQYTLVIDANESFLTSDNTIYPVYIDPSLTLYPIGNDIASTKDIIDASLYSAQPHISAGEIYYNNLGCINPNFGYSRSLIAFPGLRDILDSYSLSENNILQATLNMYCVQRPVRASTVFLYQFSNAWNESSVTANNATINDYSGDIIAHEYVTTTTTDIEFDITSLVKDWTSSHSAANKGVLLKLYTDYELDTDYAMRLASTESGSNQPYLYLNLDSYLKTAKIYRDSNITSNTASAAFNNAVNGFDETFGIKFSLKGNYSSTILNLNSSCETGSNTICNSSCGTLSSCNSIHHKASEQLLALLQDNSDPTYCIRIVSYKMCWYGWSPLRHGQVSGLADTAGKNSVVTTNSYHPASGEYSLQQLIRHELSHNLGVLDDTCTSGEDCVIRSEAGYNTWCTKHYNQILSLHPQS